MTDREYRILIIDDEPMIRELLCLKLSRLGYHCDEAGNANEALDWMSKNSADLILLDEKIPGKSGIKLLKELKQSYPGTTVILATSGNEAHNEPEVNDYITKPFNLDEVVLSVEKTIAKRMLEQNIKEYQEHLATVLRGLFLGSIETLVFTLEAKDKYTDGHSRRVTKIALAIGQTMNLPAEDMEDLHWSSLLQDVGKIAVDQSIQNKPRKLTIAEYEHIMIHAKIGANIVKHVVNDRVVAIVEHHHDHYNGTGLHQEIAGEEIPLGARILAVADSFDAMTSDRPYRSRMAIEAARQEIKRCSGSQFDPVVTDAFMNTDAACLTS